MDTNIYIYDEGIRPVDRIEFGVLGNEELERLSVFEGNDKNGVELPELFDNMEPKKSGLIDTRMGTTDPNIYCATCGFNSANCVGHFGHITLEEPVYHMGYIQYDKKILSRVCLRCSKLLVHKNEAELEELLKNKSNKARWNEIGNISKSVQMCQKQFSGCGTPVSKIRLEIKSTDISMYSEISINQSAGEGSAETFKKKIRQLITPEICYNIFKNISDKHCRMMGLTSRPELTILKKFPVPPVAVRPSFKVDFMASSTKEDDLTHKLSDILKINIKLRRYKNSTTDNTKFNINHTYLLQYHCATYYDNETSGLPKSEQRGKPSKSLASRLKGKEGRIRGNLMGKRVDFSARTVVTGDPTIDVDELRVPLKIAMTLTFPETVTPNNIDRLQELVKNGRDKYPGANFVFPLGSYDSNSDRKVLPIDLRYRKEKVVLRFGDIVERHIVDGDDVLFNRQPTLHKLSMMGHRIKVINDEDLSTFGLCPNTTKPYNADFDGDEMNLFLPQSIQTQIELSEIANVRHQIISPRTGFPSIGAIQDNILGAFNLTNPSMHIHWKDAMNIISYTSIDDFSSFKKNESYKGSKMFSLIIPSKINIDLAGATIKNGNIEKGVIKGAHIGNKQDSITHFIWNEYDTDAAVNFLNNVQKLVNNFNFYNGFSVGIGDLEISKDVYDNICKIIEQKKLEINHTITDMENNPDIVDNVSFENSIKDELNAVGQNMAVIILDDIKSDNNFGIQIKSGARGEGSNMSQMIVCLGQQNVEGARIKKKANNRSLPYFHQNDDSGPGRGFITSPFIKGMTPSEFIMHNISAREGLINTAIATAESGYIQRKLIKALEDIMIHYDGTVRNSNYTVFQFVYGDDGTDPTKQYSHSLKILKMGNKEVKEQYCFSSEQLSKIKGYSSKDNDDLYQELISKRNLIRQSKTDLDGTKTNFNDKCYLSVNVSMIVNNIKNNRTGNTKISDPKYILNKINDILKYENTKLLCIRLEDIDNPTSLKYRDEMACKQLFKLAILEYLSPKVVMFDLDLSKEDFDTICKRIIANYNKSIVEPGEMSGIIAAQSIGEPTTQMTLNTFHKTGLGVSLGTARVKELTSCSVNLKTPVMTIVLNKEIRDSYVHASKIEAHIKYTELKTLRQKIDVYWDPEVNVMMKNDNIINQYVPLSNSKNNCQKDFGSLPWLIRIELSKEKMMDSNVNLTDIKSILCSCWENKNKGAKIKKEDVKLLDKISGIAVLSNYDNDKVPVLHIRFDMLSYEYDIIKTFISGYIDGLKLKGISGISGANIDVRRVFSFNENDNEDYQIINKNHVIYTKGVNLIDIRYINGIDLYKTLTNSIVEVYNKFGIEAARASLIREFDMVFEDTSAFVTSQHISILVDLMTNTGGLTSIDRHGLHKLDTDPLFRASFEKNVEQLLNAAIFGEVDHMNSVSSRIMAGQVIRGGTGAFDVVLDTELLENSEYIDDTENKYRKTFTKLSKETVLDDIEEIAEDDVPAFYIPE